MGVLLSPAAPGTRGGEKHRGIHPSQRAWRDLVHLGLRVWSGDCADGGDVSLFHFECVGWLPAISGCVRAKGGRGRGREGDRARGREGQRDRGTEGQRDRGRGDLSYEHVRENPQNSCIERHVCVVFLSVCLHVRVCVRAHECMHACVRACGIHTCMYTYICMHAYVHTRACMRAHTHTHTHTRARAHTHTSFSPPSA